ncbi:hypothetical protein K502DRAFT_54084 [Neoconidiobolus thromboides FSU 785]|nr:hypothetical protein K502DRAFT_54084 [Neoconidiobolus thromboides FSU 785]
MSYYESYTKRINAERNFSEANMQDSRIGQLLDIERYGTSEKLEEFIGLNVPDVIKKVDEEIEFLEKELTQVKSLNQFAIQMDMELEKMQTSIRELQTNVTQSDTMLEMWSCILDTAINYQGLLRDNNWNGGLEDQKEAERLEKKKKTTSRVFDPEFFEEAQSFLTNYKEDVVIPTTDKPETLARRVDRGTLKGNTLHRQSIKHGMHPPNFSLFSPKAKHFR